MLFTAKTSYDSVLQILPKLSGTLIITNISLQQSSQQAQLYFKPQCQEQKGQVIALDRSNLPVYETEIQLKLTKDRARKIIGLGSSTNIVGYFIQNQETVPIQTIEDALTLTLTSTTNIPIKQTQPKQVRFKLRERRKPPLKEKKEQVAKQKNSSTTKRKNIEQSKEKGSKKGKSLLEMMNDLDDDDDQQQSDYQQEEESSSESSSQDQDQTPPATKKQSKQAKVQEKRIQLKNTLKNIEDPVQSKISQKISQNQSKQYKLLEKYPGLLHFSLNLATKIIRKCMSELQPIPLSLQERLKTQGNSQNTSTQQIIWLAKLNILILSMQQKYFCKNNQEKENCILQKQQFTEIISPYQKAQKSSKFQYRIPTTLPSFVLKK